jgi:hypothetical protein
MMLDRGMQTVCTLDHRMLGVTEADPRALLARLDGSVRADELLAGGPFGGLDNHDKLAAALDKCLRENLLAG